MTSSEKLIWVQLLLLIQLQIRIKIWVNQVKNVQVQKITQLLGTGTSATYGTFKFFHYDEVW